MASNKRVTGNRIDDLPSLGSPSATETDVGVGVSGIVIEIEREHSGFGPVVPIASTQRRPSARLVLDPHPC